MVPEWRKERDRQQSDEQMVNSTAQHYTTLSTTAHLLLDTPYDPDGRPANARSSILHLRILDTDTNILLLQARILSLC